MDIPPITADDLTDVLEMTESLETSISEVLEGNAHNLALSALMNATINYVLGQCRTLDEVVFYKYVFMQAFDSSIKCIKIEKPEQPS